MRISRRNGRPQDGGIDEILAVAGPSRSRDGALHPVQLRRNCGTMVDSTSEEMPEPRVRKRESISSKKITTGAPALAFSRALTKISRIFRSVSPRTC